MELRPYEREFIRDGKRRRYSMLQHAPIANHNTLCFISAAYIVDWNKCSSYAFHAFESNSATLRVRNKIRVETTQKYYCLRNRGTKLFL